MTGERLATAATVGVGVIWSNGLVKNRGLTKFIVAAPSVPFSFCFLFSLPTVQSDLLLFWLWISLVFLPFFTLQKRSFWHLHFSKDYFCKLYGSVTN